MLIPKYLQFCAFKNIEIRTLTDFDICHIFPERIKINKKL